MVIVVDDEDRENEGDLTIAAEKVTPAKDSAPPPAEKMTAASWSS